jgi:hypothetical protein
VDPIWANGRDIEMPAYLGSVSQAMTVSMPQNFPRIDIVQVRGVFESFDRQQRAFFDPEIQRVHYLNVDTKSRLSTEIVVKRGTEGASHAPDTDSGYIKLAEIHVDPETFSLTGDNIKNVTAVSQGGGNTGWTNETARTFRPSAGGLTDLSERINTEVQARKEADQNIVERIDNLPIPVQTVNGVGPDVNGNVEVDSGYTFVIDSDAALAAWAYNAPGNDYSRVRIKAGTWTLSRSISGGSENSPIAIINLPSSGTLSVVGEAGSKIILINQANNWGAFCGIRGYAEPGFGITSRDPAIGHLENVSVDMQCNPSGFTEVTGIWGHANLLRCIVTVTNNNGSGGILSGFRNCSNLTLCISTVSNNGTGGSNGFIFCENLTNCIGTGITQAVHFGNGFMDCRNLICCLGSGISQWEGFGFSNCRTGFACRNGPTQSSTATFSGCNMEQFVAGAPPSIENVWDNTANGGWNLP